MSTAIADRAPKIAVFGLLGSGNLGNHGSLDAMLWFLRRDHPEAEISCVCSGPETLERQYGVPSVAMTWFQQHGPGRSRLTTILLKMFGKVADLVRMPLLLRRYDLIIVPGMGVLETTLELNPWGFPYALFLMCLSARIAGAQVAFVSIGANFARERSIRAAIPIVSERLAVVPSPWPAIAAGCARHSQSTPCSSSTAPTTCCAICGSIW